MCAFVSVLKLISNFYKGGNVKVKDNEVKPTKSFKLKNNHVWLGHESVILNITNT